VAHCGNSLSGNFANTLTVTDLLSGWTANRATINKEAVDIVAKIKDIRAGLPFPMIGFASDNGSEFINRSLLDYLQNSKHGHIKFVRRRPYKKNDNAHVEQKNDTHVRQLFGYCRIEEYELVDLMNDIYRNYWNPLLNYFCPALKLIKKVRIGGKLRKTYDKPKTPYDRLINSGKLTEQQLARLTSDRELLDPILLKRGLDAKLRLFGERLHRFQEGKIPKAPGEVA
jgi:5S rRNA maturation endonuclease (ribonuclease M5)